MRLEPYEHVAVLAPPGVDLVGRSDEPYGGLSELEPRVRGGLTVAGGGHHADRRRTDQAATQRAYRRADHPQRVDEDERGLHRAIGATHMDFDRRVPRRGEAHERGRG